MPIAISSGCEPEQERDVLTRYPVLFRSPRPRSPLACSPSKTLVVFVPAQNNPRRRPPKPHERSVRYAQIPIARARPTSPLPPRGFLLGKLSNAGPAPAPPARNGPVSETLHRTENLKLWPAPSARGVVETAADQSASTYPASKNSLFRPRWRYARSGPHTLSGLEGH